MEQSSSILNQQSLLSQTVPTAEVNNDSTKQNQFQLTPLQHLIAKVGGEGRYQFWSFMIFNAMWFLTSWTLMGMGYFYDDRYQCFNIDNKEQCQKYICSLSQSERPGALKWHANSIVFAFPEEYFICQNSHLKPILVSLIYIGSFLGFLVIPYIADNWGRKIAMNISWTLFAFGVLFIAIADAPHLVGIGQLLTGFGCNPAITLCYSFLNEQVLGAKRQYYGVIIQVVLAFGECTIALVFLPDYSWQIVCFILLTMVLMILVSFRFLVQSPKFLISRSKQKTLQVLNQIAKINKRQPLELSEVEAIQVVDDSKAQGTSIIDLFKFGSLRMATIGGGIVFLAIQVIYYTTLLSLDDIGYTKLVNQQIVGLSQAFGYIAAEIVISRVMRKKWSLIGMCLSSVFCFILASFTLFSNEQVDYTVKIAQTISLVAGRFILCAVWALFYVYIAELYPTKVRSMGLGFVSGVGTVGSTLAPYLLYYSQKAKINEWIIPGIIGFIGFMFIFCLRQTFKKPLYDDIQQVRVKGKWQLSDDEEQEKPKQTES